MIKFAFFSQFTIRRHTLNKKRKHFCLPPPKKKNSILNCARYHFEVVAFALFCRLLESIPNSLAVNTRFQQTRTCLHYAMYLFFDCCPIKRKLTNLGKRRRKKNSSHTNFVCEKRLRYLNKHTIWIYFFFCIRTMEPFACFVRGKKTVFFPVFSFVNVMKKRTILYCIEDDVCDKIHTTSNQWGSKKQRHNELRNEYKKKTQTLCKQNKKETQRKSTYS